MTRRYTTPDDESVITATLNCPNAAEFTWLSWWPAKTRDNHYHRGKAYEVDG